MLYEVITRIVYGRNKHKWALTIGKAEKNEKGEVFRLYGTVQDITERKLSLEVIKLKEEKYKRLFNSMMNAFALHELIVDKDGKAVDYRFIEVNPAWENVITSYSIHYTKLYETARRCGSTALS